MPEVIYMKNDQEMKLVEVPRKIVDDDMMYFCNQDDMDGDDSGESLFEGFAGSAGKANPDYKTDDSGIASAEMSSS